MRDNLPRLQEFAWTKTSGLSAPSEYQSSGFFAGFYHLEALCIDDEFFAGRNNYLTTYKHQLILNNIRSLPPNIQVFELHGLDWHIVQDMYKVNSDTVPRYRGLDRLRRAIQSRPKLRQLRFKIDMSVHMQYRRRSRNIRTRTRLSEDGCQFTRASWGAHSGVVLHILSVHGVK
jgi:hypothetical protein